jgi:hypothetical protein
VRYEYRQLHTYSVCHAFFRILNTLYLNVAAFLVNCRILSHVKNADS